MGPALSRQLMWLSSDSRGAARAKPNSATESGKSERQSGHGFAGLTWLALSSFAYFNYMRHALPPDNIRD
jgi:hypothetical protein